MLHKLLICTDLDRTLIPNGPQPESPRAREYFSSLAARPEVALVYVSGRDRKLVQKAIRQYCLPMPDFVIADVGTTIYHVGPEQQWSRQPDWEHTIAKDWGERTYTELKNMLQGLSALRSQEFHKQNQYKLSYYVPIREDTEKLAALIIKRLTNEHVSARLIWSIDEPAGIGLLDILPASASKLHALEALMEKQGFNLDNSVFCGDSGNDLEVLASPVQSVLVANSQPQVQQQAKSLSDEKGNTGQLYIARGQFAGMNGNYSAGMLEGIAHYFPQTSRWMEPKN